MTAATTELAKTEEKKNPIQLDAGMVKCGNINEAYTYAAYIVKSGLAPKCFDTPEKVLIATQIGAELGLKPMQSLQTIAVINNKPAIYGKGVVGIVLSKNVMEDFVEWFEGEGDNLVAITKAKRKGLPERICRFSAADAKKAGLWGKNVWASYPRDMMQYKARARAFTIFADVLLGLPIFEDLQGHENNTSRSPESPSQPINDPLLKQVRGELTAEVEKPAKREPGDQSELENLDFDEQSIPTT